MIDLSVPVITAEGVSLFGDHADAHRRHYLPIRPRLARAADERPELKLLKYRLDPQLRDTFGGGLLLLTVDLGVDDEVLEKIRQRLAARAGGSAVTLTPVWPEDGTCQLILIDTASTTDPAGGTTGPGDLVDRVLGGATPALAADCTTMFAAVLEPAGVGLVEGALRAGGLPAGVVFDLSVSALRQALHARITADFRQAYDYFEARLHGGRLLVASDIGPSMEDLVRDETLRISVDQLVPEPDRDGVYQRALDAAQQYVLRELFQPSLGQAPPPAGGEDGLAVVGRTIKEVLGLFTATFTLRSIDRSELKTFTYDLSASEAELLTLAPQGELALLLDAAGASGDVDRFIVAVDPAPPDELPIDVAVLADLTTEGIDHVDVTLTYAGTDTVLTLDAATTRRQTSLWYTASAGRDPAYRYELHFTPAGPGVPGGLAGPLLSERAVTAHGIVRINPRQLYRRVELRVLLQGVPADRYPRVVLDVEAHEAVDGWTETATVELDANRPETTLAYRARPQGTLTLRTRHRYVRADGRESATEWVEREPGLLVIGDPEPDEVEVHVLASARFGSVVARLGVDLRPVDRPGAVTTVVLTADAPSTVWSYPAPDRGYEYRVTVQTQRAEVRTGDWLRGPAGALVVGERFTQLRQVRVVLVGKSTAQLGLLALKVRLAFTDPVAGLSAEKEVLVDEGTRSLEWEYPVADPAREAYSCQLTYIHADGTIEDRPAWTGSDLLHVEVLN